MKRFMTLVALLLVVSVAQSQEISTKTFALRGLTAGTLFSGKAYTDSQSDTSQALNLKNYRDAYVRLMVLDSAGAVTVWYRTVITGTTYADKVTIGTFAASTNNSGKFEAFALPATLIGGGKNFQLGVTFAGSGNGVSSPTYTLDVLAK